MQDPSSPAANDDALIGQCTSTRAAEADPAALTPEEALKALVQQILEDLNRDKDRNDLPGVAAWYERLKSRKPFADHVMLPLT